MEENPYESPAPSEIAWHTRLFFIAFYLLAVIGGIRQVRVGESPIVDSLFPLAMAVCLGVWAVADSKHQGRPIPFNTRWSFVVFGVFLVPCYLIWSRGWRGLGWVIANAIAWTVLSVAATMTSSIILGGGAPH
jgi:hypothetical protein